MQSKSRRGAAWAAVPALAALALSVGVSAGFLFAPAPIPPALRPAPVTGTLPLVYEDFTDDRDVEVSVVSSPSPKLASPRSGTITDISCMPGIEWSSGETRLSVDGERIPLFYTDVPLWRDLQMGVRGEDVGSVQRELSRLGYSTAESNVYDRATRQSVRSFFSDRGIADTGYSLGRAGIVWLPSAVVSVQTCGLVRGAQVSQGETVAELPPTVTAIRVASPPANLVGGTRVLQVGNVEVAVDESLAIVETSVLGSITQTPEYLAFVEADGAIPLVGRLRLAEPVLAASIPPSSVLVDADKQACVTFDGTAYTVRLLGAYLGRVLVAEAESLTQVDIVATTATCS